MTTAVIKKTNSNTPPLKKQRAVDSKHALDASTDCTQNVICESIWIICLIDAADIGVVLPV